MLVLSRKKDEVVRIGDNIVVKVLRTGPHVKLGIEAPAHVKVLREELLDQVPDSQGGDNAHAPAA